MSSSTNDLVRPKQFSITRRIEIDMAHRIPDHKSKCFNIHGHRYVIEATCTGNIIEEGEQTGMVMDFGFLKSCMMLCIHDHFDHGAAFYFEDPLVLDGTINCKPGWKVCLLTDVPTAENLAKVWYEALKEEIERFFMVKPVKAPRLKHLDVWETPNCVARYPV